RPPPCDDRLARRRPRVVIALERPIKFEEVDAANIVFFARFATYAHEGMEHFFGALEGGYAGLILKRRIGFPAVHLEADFASPARYGDDLRIEMRVLQLGNKSAVFGYRMLQANGGALVCTLKHTVVITDLDALKSAPMPADVR